MTETGPVKLSHDALAESLAAHLRTDRRMTWCDIQLGSAGSVRPDVYAIFKSYVNPCPTAYEVKVSRSDFLSDVTSGKWQSYLRYASAVYFACQDDLISPKELPDRCGLIVLKNEWRAKKKAVLSPVEIPQEALLKLIIDGVEREGPRVRARHFHGLSYEESRKKFGDMVANIIRDTQAAEVNIEHARRSADRITQQAQERADEIRKTLQPLRKQLCDLLQLPESSKDWDLIQGVDRLRRDLQEHPAQQQLRDLTRQIERAINLNGYKKTSEVEV